MLKVFLGFLVSVVVLLSSAYVVSPTYATSANVVLTQIQAGGVGAATQEFIVIYNNSPEEVDISGWCLTNKSHVSFACFTTALAGQARYLPAFNHAVAVSSSFAATQALAETTTIYTPTNQSSGSLTGSSDTVSLIDHTGNTIDQHSWTSSITAGMQFERHASGDAPMIYQDTNVAADWSITTPTFISLDQTYVDTTIVDVCPNIEGDQVALPFGKMVNELGECVDRIISLIDITEVLPNAMGSDEGQEFIELYNPGGTVVALSDYKLYVGPSYEDAYDFPAGAVIQPGQYLGFSNSDIPFSFLNSSSRALLALQDGMVISEVPSYESPKDGQSWALIDGAWQYTNQPTSGAENLANNPALDTSISTGELCAANQYRNPDTGRCKLIATSTVTPCKDNQYRSEETGRCRNIVSEVKTVTPCDTDEERNLETNRCRKIVAATEPAPCKEGQERNPDTNRCRTITKMPSADYGVLGAETKSSGNWYVLAAIVGVLLLALGYAVWEWHNEIGKLFRKVLGRARKLAHLRK